MNSRLTKLVQEAEQVYQQNWNSNCWFERAVFLSWYCALGDCTFCYMSTQKDKIKDPSKARRRLSSVLAEVLLTKKFGWKVEFLSAGYGSYSPEEMLELVKVCSQVYGNKLWLNIGYLNQEQLLAFLPYLEGISVSIETVNWNLRKKVCPSKPVEPMLKTLDLADKYDIKKAITIIVGLGEATADIEELFRFIEKYKLDRVTFYSLNPHPGTSFTKGPETEYYLEWIARTRVKFPKLEIIAGSWVNRLDEIHLLLKAGANAFTKFPALKLFGSKYAYQIEAEVSKAKRKLEGSLTDQGKIDWGSEIKKLKLEKELQVQVELKLKQYLKSSSGPE
ncbi:MAG: radical SAM protein [Candidatus Woesearchaeota archaeon]|jgi:biotin synthase-like enzyme